MSGTIPSFHVNVPEKTVRLDDLERLPDKFFIERARREGSIELSATRSAVDDPGHSCLKQHSCRVLSLDEQRRSWKHGI